MTRFTFILAFALLTTASAFAQPQPPKDYITGNYRLTLTIDGTKYRVDVAGYRGSWVGFAGDSVMQFDIWIAPDALQRAGLPAIATLKGKQSSATRFFKETTPGNYQKIVMENVSIVSAGLGGGPLTLRINVGGLASREDRSGVHSAGSLSIPGVRSAGSLSIPFSGPSSPLGDKE